MRVNGLKRTLLLALACCLALLPGRAETVGVFGLNLNVLGNGGFSQERKTGIAAFLANGGSAMNFGFFYNMKLLNYFNLTSETHGFVSEATQKVVFTYDKNRYTPVGDPTAYGQYGHAVSCIFKDAADQHYAVVMLKSPSKSQAFDLSNLAKFKGYTLPVRTALDAIRVAHPGIRIYACYLKQYCYGEDALKAYLTTGGDYSLIKDYPPLGMSLVADGGAEGGAVYTFRDATVGSVSGGAVSIEGEKLKAATGFVTYASSVNVTFTDGLTGKKTVVAVPVGGTATPPDPAEHEGYDFAGWDGSYENVTEDCEVTATYAIKTFTVKFADEDGSAIAVREGVEWGTSAEAPEPPQREGETFLRWDSDAYLSVKDNLIITAVYEELANIFTVRFLDADGTVLKSEQVVRGEAATAPDDPTPPAEGQVFYGWSPAVFSDIASDLDVTAVYGPAVREVGSLEDFATAITALPAVATLRLTADLDFAGATYVPPVLRGTVDGNGHVITNLKTALFETVSGGTVKDLTLRTSCRAHTGFNQKGGLLANRLEGATVSGVTVEDGVFTSQNSSCGLATIAYWAMPDASGTATVVSNCVARNCRMTGISSSLLGGIVGEASDGTLVVDCRFETDDPSQVALGQGPEKAGGIIALSQGATVVRCTAEGEFRCASGSQSAGVGGIVGAVGGNTTTLVACTNRASVVFAAANGSAGGLVGRGMKATCVITDCVNLGAVVVEGDENSVSTLGCGAGGLMGGAWGNAPVTLAGSRNEGAVTVHDFRSAGGLLGVSEGTDSGIAHVFVTNSVNVGAVTSAQDAGGLVGWVSKTEPDLTLLNCGNLGAVHSATGHVGGVVGAVNGMAQNNNKDFVFTRIANVMNAGALTTDSGTVGTFAGRLAASDRNAYAFALTGIFLPERGETPLVGEVVGKDGTGATADESCRLALPATAFADRTVVKALNVRAAAEGLAVWGQTALGPDLTLFVPDRKSGMIVIVR